MDMFVFRDKTVRINIDFFLDAFSNTEESKQCMVRYLFSVFDSTCFQHSLPPSPVQLFFLSSMPSGLKTHLRQLHSSSDLLGFKVPAVSSAAGWPFFLISSFKDQRRMFPEGRGQGEELVKIETISFLICVLRLFWFWFSLNKGCSALLLN